MNVFNNAFSENPAKVEIPPDDKPEEKVTNVETLDPPPEPAESSSAQEEKPEAEKPEEKPSNRDEDRPVKMVPHEALHAERKRREAAEAEAERLRTEQKKPPTSVLEDEDKAFQERLAEASRPIVQRLFNMSVAAAKRAHEDYQSVYDFMESEVVKHPELMQAINQADDPGEYIYQLGKTRKELAEVGGDFTQLRSQIAAEERAKTAKAEERVKVLEAELAALKASKEKREAIPQSLNAEASGAVKGDAFSGPTPLRSVFSN